MKTFMGLMDEYSDCSIVIFPISYEGTVSYGKGTGKGAEAIISASYQVEPYDIDTESVLEGGVFSLPLLELDCEAEKAVDQIYNEAMKHVDKFIFTIGGEHSVSIGVIKALFQKYSKLSVLQIDAHTDLSDSYEGSKFNHACVIRRALDYGCNAVQVGIRSVSPDVASDLDKLNIKIHYAKDVYDKQDWKDVVAELGENVYITIDVDGFDPSLIPATGTPEPGGLGWYNVISLLKETFATKNVVGCDIVELAPNGQHSSEFICAKLAFKIISMERNKK